MVNPEISLELKNAGYEVITLKHAYRVNGVVDIWFSGRMLFDLTKKQYIKVKSPIKQLIAAHEIIESNEKRDPFKKLESNRMSYQEFKNKKDKIRPEYYHWNNDRNESSDYLYFIRVGVNVKIGRSKNPKQRLSSLKTAMADKPALVLDVQGKGHMEKILHGCFSEFRKEGEWFFFSQEIKDFVNKIRGYDASL